MMGISVTHEAHRRLRAPLDRLFARASIARVEPRIVARTQKLCDRLGAFKDTGEVVSLSDAISSLTTDIISSIVFEDPSDYLGAPDFNKRWYRTLKMGTKSVPVFKNLPWVVSYVFSLVDLSTGCWRLMSNGHSMC